MTLFCNLIVLSCQLLEIIVKVVLFFLTCNGLLTRSIQTRCQRCSKCCSVVMRCSCHRWLGCSQKCTVRSGLKVFVRCFHGILTLGIAASLVYYKTGLRGAIYNYDFFYCACFFGTLTVSLVSYYISCFVDPGYVPVPIRSRHNTFDSDDDDILEPIVESTTMIIEKTKLRKCGFCGVWQPLRARHCEDCNQCVRRFDHHCPWLETCIGEGNHRYFLVFVLSKAVIAIWASVVICQALEFHNAWGAWLWANAVLLVDLCVTVSAAVIVTVLSCLHTYLMAANLTTWEMVSRHRISYLKHLDEDLNPFHQGYCSNIYSFLCASTAPPWDEIYRANNPEEPA